MGGLLDTSMVRVLRPARVLFVRRIPFVYLHLTPQNRLASNYGPPLPGQVGPQPGDNGGADGEDNGSPRSSRSPHVSTGYKMFESAATTFASLAVLG